MFVKFISDCIDVPFDWLRKEITTKILIVYIIWFYCNIIVSCEKDIIIVCSNIIFIMLKKTLSTAYAYDIVVVGIDNAFLM